MTSKSYSLLSDPLISVRTGEDVVEQHTLPQVLVALGRDDVLSFEALQAHQQQAWYSFLVQIAAMGAAREAGGAVPGDAEAWKEVLTGLADGSEAAWHLINHDLAEPAFMQPPVPEGSLDEAGYKADVPTPDQLDVLITSKNHDVKGQRVVRPDPEHWLFALITLQTMEGFLGRGNYGIVRMNGGFGNRPMVGLTKGLSWGARYRRDVDVLFDARDDIAERFQRDGHALLWKQPWDGAKESGIPLNTCDPHFVEICRRIRFLEEDVQIVCWRANTKGQRVAAPDALNGVTGDPWTPVEKKGNKALTVGESGFTYDLLQQIFLSGEYARPQALAFQKAERSGAYLVARTLVRGQGKTDGLHHRIVPVKERVSSTLFGEPSEREKLAKRAQRRVDEAARTQRKVLYPAVAALLSSGRDDRIDWDRAAPWIEAFDEAVDDIFFGELWASVDLSEEAASRRWQERLLEEAQVQFEEAKGGTPVATVHRWRALSKAESVFNSQARRVLDRAFEDESNTNNEEGS